MYYKFSSIDLFRSSKVIICVKLCTLYGPEQDEMAQVTTSYFFTLLVKSMENMRQIR